MAAGNITYQIISISHNSVAFDEPIGAALRQIIQFLPVTFADNVWAQVMPTTGKQVEAEADSYSMADEHTQGAKGTLAMSLKEADGGTATISVTNMLVGNINREMKSPPYEKSTDMINEGVPVISITL